MCIPARTPLFFMIYKTFLIPGYLDVSKKVPPAVFLIDLRVPASLWLSGLF